MKQQSAGFFLRIPASASDGGAYLFHRIDSIPAPVQQQMWSEPLTGPGKIRPRDLSLLSTLLGNWVMSSHYRVESLKQLHCTLEPSRGPVYGRAAALDCISLRRGACVRSGATIV